jgi:two-component system response regulator
MSPHHQVEILLVEDNPDDLELTLHALRSDKVANKIEVARDGEEALDYFFRRGRFAARALESEPSLVLLDLKLPKVDGLEVLREVKNNPATRTIPVVILTSSREEKDIVMSYQLGVNSYIQKPVDFNKFRETAKQLGLYWLIINQTPPVHSSGGR